MAVKSSTLSAAVRALADALSANITPNITVTVATPKQAYEQARTSETHILNIFPYNISPSNGFASVDQQQQFFVRAYVLITACAGKQGVRQPDVELRVLGQAVEVLHRFPIIPVRFHVPHSDTEEGGAQDAPHPLRCTLQAFSAEEMNHIWSTQGLEIPYRLSVAYELAQIPIGSITEDTLTPNFP